MWKKFKELNLILKIVVAIIAIILLPITLLLLAVEWLIKSIKSRKIISSVVAGLLSLICLFLAPPCVSGMIEGLTSSPEEVALEEQKAEEEKIKVEQEAEEKAQAEAEEKAKAEEQAKKEAEEKAKAEQDQKEKEEAEAKAEQEAKEKEEQDKQTTTKKSNDSNNKSDSSSNNSDSGNSITVYCNGGSSTSNKYHKSANAHGMKGAIEMTKKEAKASGYVACKRCY